MKNAKTLPKKAIDIRNGGIYEQKVRCGKKNCKCARGEKHLAYYYFTRDGERLTKTYIRKSELKAFAELVEEAKEWRRFIRNVDEIGKQKLIKAKLYAVTLGIKPGRFNQVVFDKLVEKYMCDEAEMDTQRQSENGNAEKGKKIIF